ncbi:MAG TPA: hypothetical protein VGC22_04490 [Chitinophaga sp.]
MIGAFCAIGAAQLLKQVQETGEADHTTVMADMRAHIQQRIKARTSKRAFQKLVYLPAAIPALRRKRRMERAQTGLEKWMK